MKNLPNILKEAKATRERLDYEKKMADPENWREGDVVEVIWAEPGDPFEIGQRLLLLEDGCHLPYCGGGGRKSPMGNNQLKWISR